MTLTAREGTASLLKRARKAAGFSNAKDFLADIKASGRRAPSYSTYAQWESGEVAPRENTIEPVIDYHRERKTWPDDPPAPELATALRDLAVVVEGVRAEQAAWRRGIVAALAATEGPAREALLAALVPQPLESAQQ